MNQNEQIAHEIALAITKEFIHDRIEYARMMKKENKNYNTKEGYFAELSSRSADLYLITKKSAQKKLNDSEKQRKYAEEQEKIEQFAKKEKLVPNAPFEPYYGDFDDEPPKMKLGQETKQPEQETEIKIADLYNKFNQDEFTNHSKLR